MNNREEVSFLKPQQANLLRRSLEGGLISLGSFRFNGWSHTQLDSWAGHARREGKLITHNGHPSSVLTTG